MFRLRDAVPPGEGDVGLKCPGSGEASTVDTRGRPSDARSRPSSEQAGRPDRQAARSGAGRDAEEPPRGRRRVELGRRVGPLRPSLSHTTHNQRKRDQGHERIHTPIRAPRRSSYRGRGAQEEEGLLLGLLALIAVLAIILALVLGGDDDKKTSGGKVAAGSGSLTAGGSSLLPVPPSSKLDGLKGERARGQGRHRPGNRARPRVLGRHEQDRPLLRRVRHRRLRLRGGLGLHGRGRRSRQADRGPTEGARRSVGFLKVSPAASGRPRASSREGRALRRFGRILALTEGVGPEPSARTRPDEALQGRRSRGS